MCSEIYSKDAYIEQSIRKVRYIVKMYSNSIWNSLLERLMYSKSIGNSWLGNVWLFLCLARLMPDTALLQSPGVVHINWLGGFSVIVGR